MLSDSFWPSAICEKVVPSGGNVRAGKVFPPERESEDQRENWADKMNIDAIRPFVCPLVMVTFDYTWRISRSLSIKPIKHKLFF
jgi:hypothetical protein